MARTKQTARMSTGGKAAAMRVYMDARARPSTIREPGRSAPLVQPHNATTEDSLDVSSDIGSDGSTQQSQFAESDGPIRRIAELLRRVKSTSEYSFGGAAKELPTAPGLEIKAFGAVSLPLRAETAELLIPYCEQAPFGRKYDTMVDLDVRRSWQISSDCVTIQNPAWQTGLDLIIPQIATRLGCKGVPLQCKLYKMLLYGPGGHFAKHKDTEKDKGMFATLVIQVPSMHQGTDKYEHDFGSLDGNAPFLNHYAVHFADSEHQLLPVTSGYRIALVYSLCWPENIPQTLLPSIDTPVAESIATEIKSFDNDEAMIYYFRHEYTDTSISSFGSCALKGRDRGRWKAIMEANDTLDPSQQLIFFLVSLELSIDSYDVSGRGYDYDEEEGEWEESDRAIDIKRWFMIDGTLLGPHNSDETLEDFEVLNPDNLDDDALWGDPSSEDYEGYLGNEGATKSSVYHRYALIAWPRRNNMSMCFTYINEKAALAEWESGEVTPEKVEALLDEWIATENDCVDEYGSTVIKALTNLGDADLIVKFFEALPSSAFSDVKTIYDHDTADKIAGLVLAAPWNDVKDAVLNCLCPWLADSYDSCSSMSSDHEPETGSSNPDVLDLWESSTMRYSYENAIAEMENISYKEEDDTDYVPPYTITAAETENVWFDMYGAVKLLNALYLKDSDPQSQAINDLILDNLLDMTDLQLKATFQFDLPGYWNYLYSKKQDYKSCAVVIGIFFDLFSADDFMEAFRAFPFAQAVVVLTQVKIVSLTKHFFDWCPMTVIPPTAVNSIATLILSIEWSLISECNFFKSFNQAIPRLPNDIIDRGYFSTINDYVPVISNTVSISLSIIQALSGYEKSKPQQLTILSHLIQHVKSLSNASLNEDELLNLWGLCFDFEESAHLREVTDMLLQTNAQRVLTWMKKAPRYLKSPEARRLFAARMELIGNEVMQFNMKSQWMQPKAVFPGPKKSEMEAFFHGPKESMIVVPEMTGIANARRFAKIYGGHQNGYSATMVAAGVGSRAHVVVTKTLDVWHQEQAQIQSVQLEYEEYRKLINDMSDSEADAVSSTIPAKRSAPNDDPILIED